MLQQVERVPEAAAAEMSRRDWGWFSVSVVMRLVVGGFFIYAAANKIAASPAQFAKNIASFQLVHPSAINAIAIVLPWVEIISGVLLVAGLWVKESRLLITAMLAVFLGGTVNAWVNGIPIECGCTGEAGVTPHWHVVARNTAFLGCLALDAYALRRSRPRLVGSTSTRSSRD